MTVEDIPLFFFLYEKICKKCIDFRIENNTETASTQI